MQATMLINLYSDAMYSYKDRYMLQANVRADASSRFAADYRWGVFLHLGRLGYAQRTLVPQKQTD